MNARIHLIPYGDDPLGKLAEHLLHRHATKLPFLNHITVLFPSYGAVPRFRRLLLDAAGGREALIPPWTGTPQQWAQRMHCFSTRPLSPAAREMLLYEAIVAQPGLGALADPWTLVDNLLELFDALSTSHHQVADDFAGFRRRLSGAYRCKGAVPRQLNAEAKLVHELWSTWRERLADLGLWDPVKTYADTLRSSPKALDTGTPIYLAGFVRFTDRELEWLAALLACTRTHLFIHGRPGRGERHPGTPVSALLASLDHQPPIPRKADDYSNFLDTAFENGTEDIRARARDFVATVKHSPATGRLAVFEAAYGEQEARAIDLQVRLWSLQGKRHIGIVTADRKLARRVRALLERANILLQDTAGWRLSTTSAAAALMHWLDSVENDFAAEPLLALLRSPFVAADADGPELKKIVACFERQIILQQNCSSDLAAYRAATEKRGPAIRATYGDGILTAIVPLLQRLDRASGRLRTCLGKRPRPAADYLRALGDSLNQLGMRDCFRRDDAGRCLLERLDDMRAALVGRKLRLRWHEFRGWLARDLERHNFRPPPSGRNVELMGFAESRLYRFDAMIIAGATAEHLPGGDPPSPFFNDAVRLQLGLPTAADRRGETLYDFRRLLESATAVLVTLRREREGEPMAPSPWLERVRVFHQLCYGDRLTASELDRLVASPATLISARDEALLPEAKTHPAPKAPAALIPSRISASAYQRLLDCPYRYFSHDCLGLAALPELQETLEKVDYGERVHRILRAFHGDVPGLPGPFDKAMTPDTLPQARRLLTEIGQAVFARDVAADFMARAWLYRWQAIIPSYLRWQQQRAQTWRTVATEAELETAAGAGDPLILQGRIDRIDTSEGGWAILDYKTGWVPPSLDVENGEQIQLPFYALLTSQKVEQALFVRLDPNRAPQGTVLEGAPLRVLTAAVRDRLVDVIQALRRDNPLPAWGDPASCQYCVLEGLCRKQFWRDDPHPAVAHGNAR